MVCKRTGAGHFTFLFHFQQHLIPPLSFVSIYMQESGQLLQRLHSAASIDGVTRDALEVLGHLSLASWLSLANSTPRSPGAGSGSLTSWSSVGTQSLLRFSSRFSEGLSVDISKSVALPNGHDWYAFKSMRRS